MEPTSFEIVVSCDEKDKELRFDRLYTNGERVFITSVSLSDINAETASVTFDKFAKTLGENLLIFLPTAKIAVGL